MDISKNVFVNDDNIRPDLLEALSDPELDFFYWWNEKSFMDSSGNDYKKYIKRKIKKKFKKTLQWKDLTLFGFLNEFSDFYNQYLHGVPCDNCDISSYLWKSKFIISSNDNSRYLKCVFCSEKCLSEFNSKY
jgi:hypothetical protein